MSRTHHPFVAAVAAVATLASVGSVAIAAQSDPVPELARTTDADARIDRTEFRSTLRTLWIEHVTWTRLYIISAIAGLPDLEATAGRLLANQDDIGDAFAAFYGDDAGAALAELLRDHIVIAGDLVGTAVAGGDTTTDTERWYANADDIAEFLAAANPAWPVEAVRDLMYAHLDQTLAEATARLSGDWTADIAVYDEIQQHIQHMSDVLADGVVAQFPERFTP